MLSEMERETMKTAQSGNSQKAPAKASLGRQALVSLGAMIKKEWGSTGLEDKPPQIHCIWRGKGVATGGAAPVRKVLGYQTKPLDYNLWKVTWDSLPLLLTPARPSSKMIN